MGLPVEDFEDSLEAVRDTLPVGVRVGEAVTDGVFDCVLVTVVVLDAVGKTVAAAVPVTVHVEDLVAATVEVASVVEVAVDTGVAVLTAVPLTVIAEVGDMFCGDGVAPGDFVTVAVTSGLEAAWRGMQRGNSPAQKPCQRSHVRTEVACT